MCFTAAAELNLVAGTAIGTGYPQHAARSLMRDRGSAVLIYQCPAGKTI